MTTTRQSIGKYQIVRELVAARAPRCTSPRTRSASARWDQGRLSRGAQEIEDGAFYKSMF